MWKFVLPQQIIDFGNYFIISNVTEKLIKLKKYNGTKVLIYIVKN